MYWQNVGSFSNCWSQKEAKSLCLIPIIHRTDMDSTVQTILLSQIAEPPCKTKKTIKLKKWLIEMAQDCFDDWKTRLCRRWFSLSMFIDMFGVYIPFKLAIKNSGYNYLKELTAQQVCYISHWEQEYHLWFC